MDTVIGPVHYHIGGFPPDEFRWNDLISLIGPANASIARYDGLLKALPNSGVLLSPLMTQEAVLSSRIEGTEATMGEVLEFEAEDDSPDLPEAKRNDIEEILNYRKAMRRAEEMLQTVPLCQRVIKEAHAILLEGVRGHDKAPGEYRRVPNWIGPKGCSIEEARYVPISADKLLDAMSAWEKYMHGDVPDRLVQLAILHAEFEALHPFLDGNGRLGRMLVPLFLAQHELLSAPMFYISAFFERNRDEYYERLLSISRDRDWTPWVAFFLRSVTEQAAENQQRAEDIRQLYDDTARRISEISHSQYALQATEFLFRRPIFKGSDFYKDPGMTPASGRRILGLLEELGFFRVVRAASGRRSAVFAYRELLNIAEGRNLF
jgi:Fic family protein